MTQCRSGYPKGGLKELKDNELLTVLAILDTNYRVKTMPKEQIAIWYELLKDIDYSIINKAVQKIMLTSKFYPTIAEIRSNCLELVQGHKKSGMEAWGIFRQYVNLYSTSDDYQRLKKDHPDVYDLVKSVGGRELLMGNASFVRPEFERMYNEHREVLINRQLLPTEFRRDIDKLRSTVYAQLEAGEMAEAY